MDRSTNDSPSRVEVKGEPESPDEDSSFPRGPPLLDLRGAAGYSCQQCDATFSTMERFIAHMRMVHLASLKFRQDSTSCLICGQSFAGDQACSAHMLEHFLQTSRTFTCTACPPRGAVRPPAFSSHQQFKQHFASTHIDVLYRCRLCLKLSTDFEHLKEHSVSHATENEQCRCVACDQSFPSEPLLMTHIESQHRVKETGRLLGVWKPQATVASAHKKTPLPLPPATGGKSTATTLVKCTVCDEKLQDELALAEHKLVYHCKVNKSDRCMLCHFGLPDTESFIAHSLHHFSTLDSALSASAGHSCIVCRQTICGATQIRMHAAYHVMPYADDKSDERRGYSSGLPLESSVIQTPLKSLFDEEITAAVDASSSRKRCAKTWHGGERSQGGTVKRRLRCAKCWLSFTSVSSLIIHRRRHVAK